MDWFERLTGFKELPYSETQRRLKVVDGRLSAATSDRTYGVGTLTTPSLGELRGAVSASERSGRLRLSIAEGDVREMHRSPANQNALFQVASQFNMLEMIGPDVTPEDGVTRYQHDRTQGPACAMAAGAATIFRNYLVPMPGGIGQTECRQLDGLADIGTALSERIGIEKGAMWTMRNGYALPSRDGLDAISRFLRKADPETLDALRAALRVGLHADVEVTDGSVQGILVNQIFCSALPVAYRRLPSEAWEPLARLVLEAAYEATVLAAVLNSERVPSKRLLLTRLGGGAFGNESDWIDDAITRALALNFDRDLDVAIVSYGRPEFSTSRIVDRIMG